MKKIYPYIILVILISIVIVLGIRFLAGEEDTWLCVNGEWVKHGTPGKSKPLSGCSQENVNAKNTNISNTNSEIIKNTNIAPNNKEACEAKDGVWGIVGLSEKEECNLKTKDGGKECLDGGNCETKICITELTDNETERYNNGEIITKKGKCPEWQMTTGCYSLVEGGVATSSICFYNQSKF